MPFWFFFLTLSIQLPSKYQYLQPVLIVLGLPIGVIGMFGTPFLLSKLREADTKALIEKVREWEPVIQGQLSIRGLTPDSAYNKTIKDIKEFGNLPVPLHIRNAPTRLMKELGYGKGYKYSPNYDYKEKQDYLPKELKGRRYLK